MMRRIVENDLASEERKLNLIQDMVSLHHEVYNGFSQVQKGMEVHITRKSDIENHKTDTKLRAGNNGLGDWYILEVN